MKKILSVGILFLLIGISVTTSTGNINEASRTSCTNPLLPPLMWTEDFTTYFLCIPNNPDGHNVFYYIDWGDGDTTGWLGPFLSNETISISHLWDEGIYSIKLKAKSHYNESKWAEYLLSLSSIEKLFLPKLGYININYKFTIYKEGYDGYIFDWGDGTYSNWVDRIANKSFNYPGEYDIRFKAKDIHGNQTNWSTPISITILPLIGASLGITKVNSGIFSFTIKNFGNEPAVNVSWSIHFYGGIVIPREQESFNNYNNLNPEEEWTIKFWFSAIPEEKHLVFGIGRVTITIIVNAENIGSATKTIDGFVILLFVII